MDRQTDGHAKSHDPLPEGSPPNAKDGEQIKKKVYLPTIVVLYGDLVSEAKCTTP